MGDIEIQRNRRLGFAAMVKKASRYVEEFEDWYGLIGRFLRKFEFEDKEEFDYSVYKDLDPDSDDEEIADLHQNVKRHLKQIRESFGFDVDCRVPSWFGRSFFPVDLSAKKKSVYGAVIEAAKYAIREINNERQPEKRYEIVEVEKAVMTSNFLILATIKVEESAVDADAVSRTIQAIVFEHFTYGFDLHQWRFKPDPVVQQA